MFKKVLAAFLAASMVLSLSAFAAVTTDSVNEKTVRTDDFEGKSHPNNKNYPRSAAGSDVFYDSTVNADYKGRVVGSLVSAVGRDGNTSKVFESYLRSGEFALAAVFDATDTSKVHQISYDIKVDKLADVRLMGRSYAPAKYPLFGFDSNGNVVKYNTSGTAVDSTIGTYQADTWYRVVSYYTNGVTYGWLIAPDGTAIYNTTSVPSQKTHFMTVAYMDATNTAKTHVYIDNATHATFDPTQNAPYVTKAPIESGGIVTADTQTLTVQFDQVVSPSSSTVTVTPAGGEAMACGFAVVQNQPYTYTITLPSLAVGTEYTLDLSGVKNSGSLPLTGNAAYTFTTPIQLGIESTLPSDGEENVAANIKEMTVTFNRAVAEAPETVTITGGGETITANVVKVNDTEYKLDFSDRTADLKGLTTYTAVINGFKDSEENQVNTEISFTTENTATLTYADSFENAALVPASNNGYNTGMDNALSPVSMAASNRPSDDATEVSLVPGFTLGTTALQLQTGKKLPQTYIEPMKTNEMYTLTDDNKIIVTYRFKLDKMATYDTANYKYGSQIGLGSVYSGDRTPDISKFSMAITTNSSGKPVVSYREYFNGTDSKEISVNKWYNIIWVMGKGYEVKYFIDSETGEVVFSKQDNFAAATLADKTTWKNYIIPVAGRKTQDKESTGTIPIYNEDQSFTIDDFTIWELKPERQAQALRLAEGITENNGEYTFTFNQPVMTNSTMWTLRRTDGSRVFTDVTIKNTDFCEQTVSFTGLEPLEEYTIDCSLAQGLVGTKYTSDSSQSNPTLTGAFPDEKMAVIGDVTATGLNAGDAINVNLYSDSARSTDLVFAFYEKTFPATLSTVIIKNDESLQLGENDVEVPLSYNVNADYVKIFALESDGSLVPLMEEYKVLKPYDTLDILFIGSSLSEDSTRLFDQILKAQGEDIGANRKINTVTKFVGGGGFNYHGRNLKNEVEAGLEEAIKTGDTAAIDAYVAEQQAIMDAKEGKETDYSRRLYTTFRNGVQKEKEDREGVDHIMLSALLEKQYDFISLQPSANAYTSFEGFEEELRYLASTIRRLQPNAEILIFQTWSQYRSTEALRMNTFTDYIKPFVNTWAQTAGNSSEITEDGDSLIVSPAGYAFYLAEKYLDWTGTKYVLDEGNSSAAAKDAAELSDKFNTSRGLLRDANHASLYGTFLADAVWYEMFTGKKASAGTVENPAIRIPTGVGPKYDSEGALVDKNYTYFTITPEEHYERLSILSDIAHMAVTEYNKNVKRIKAN